MEKSYLCRNCLYESEAPKASVSGDTGTLRNIKIKNTKAAYL